VEKITEDAFDHLISSNFNNNESRIIYKVRSQRDESLQKAFKKFKKDGNQDKLMASLRELMSIFQENPAKVSKSFTVTK